MSTYIAPISWGLGDLIVSLPVVQSLIAAGEQTYLITRSSLQEGLGERISGLSGCVQEESFDRLSLSSGDRLYNLRDHPLQTNYWWGSAEFERDYPGHKINDILQKICADLGIDADFNQLVPLKSMNRPEFNGKVVLLPGTDGSYKYWPRLNWIQLFERLSAAGESAVIVGQPDNCPAVKELLQAGLPWLSTPRLDDALDAVSSCSLVIGVDTGLMHLSVQQGTPTIALYRPNPIYIRPQSNCYAISAESCDATCIEKSLGCASNDLTSFEKFQPKSWACELSDSDRCMGGISMIQVLDKVHTARSSSSTRVLQGS